MAALEIGGDAEPNAVTRQRETPARLNSKREPKEDTHAAMDDGWVRGPMRRMIMAFERSLRENPPIAPGAPDEFDPARTDKAQ